MASTFFLLFITAMVTIQLGQSTPTVGPGNCNSYLTYNTNRSQGEMVYDALRIQQRILRRTEYDIVSPHPFTDI